MAKKSQTMDTKKNQTNKKRNHRKYLLTVGIVVTVLVACFVYRAYSTRVDRLRFVDASQRKTQLTGRIVDQVHGTILGQAEKNLCYNSEQGPYDNGRLWCQTASAIYYADELDAGRTKDTIRKIVTTSGWGIAGRRAADVEFEGAKDLPCGIDVLTGSIAQAPGYYLPEYKDAKTVVVLNCSDRARAKHYPYMP